MTEYKETENGQVSEEETVPVNTGPAETGKPEKKFDLVKEIVSFVRDMAVCMVVVYLIMNFIVRPIGVLGSSMYPTLQDKEIGLSNTIGKKMSGLDRFDIAIIYIEQKDEYIVKRVVGLPGETVYYEDGQLYINGEPVAEDFLNRDYMREYETNEGKPFMADMDPVVLGEDEYLCLGDNRPNSTDSRFYGPFKNDQIASKGVIVLWPLNKIGLHTW